MTPVSFVEVRRTWFVAVETWRSLAALEHRSLSGQGNQTDRLKPLTHGHHWNQNHRLPQALRWATKNKDARVFGQAPFIFNAVVR